MLVRKQNSTPPQFVVSSSTATCPMMTMNPYQSPLRMVYIYIYISASYTRSTGLQMIGQQQGAAPVAAAVHQFHLRYGFKVAKEEVRLVALNFAVLHCTIVEKCVQLNSLVGNSAILILWPPEGRTIAVMVAKIDQLEFQWVGADITDMSRNIL